MSGTDFHFLNEMQRKKNSLALIHRNKVDRCLARYCPRPKRSAWPLFSSFLAVHNSSTGLIVCRLGTTNNQRVSQHYRVTLETCDLWDIWSDRFLDNFQIFEKNFKRCQNCLKLSNILKLLKIVKKKLSKIFQKIVKMLVRSYFLITLIKCLKGHKSLELLFVCQK